MKKLFAFLLVCTLAFSLSMTAFAAEKDDTSIDLSDVPVIDDTVDFSGSRDVVYSYENDGIVIQSYEASAAEIAHGQALQQLHVHEGGLTRHFSLTPHKHFVKDVVSQSPKYYVWRPTEAWTVNDRYPNNDDWPTVAWEVGQSTTVGASVNTTVGVTDSVVSVELGSEFTVDHTISTSTTRTFKVPYKKDGRVKVNFYRPYKTFTCLTEYYYTSGPTVVTIPETGKGSALGKPYDIRVNIETRNI